MLLDWRADVLLEQVAFNSGMWLGRIVVHIEEAKRLRALHDKLKNIVTMVKLPYEENYQPQKTATNFTNIIITTNISTAVYVPYDDRRILAIIVSSEKIGDATYFDRLFDDIKDPLVLLYFYDF